MGSASLDGFAIFAGGAQVSLSSTVDVYDSTLMRSTPAGISTARRNIAGATAGNYALFAGGDINGASEKVDVYTVQ